MDRPAIPRPLEREVLIESGHRCAVTTCRQSPVVIAHIIPWKIVKEHTFENLIALCPTCHARYDKGDIDRQSMIRYKANLAIIQNRYGDWERRVLSYFADNPDKREIHFPIGFTIFLSYLIKDGLLEQGPQVGPNVSGTFPRSDSYWLTDKGVQFVSKWLVGEDIK
jgi:hypothetical protein